jgi:hypothetical protein
MDYMLLIIEDTGERLRPPIDERRERYRTMVAFADDLAAKGKLKVAQALALPDQGGVRVRKRGEGPAMVDGPFAEAKEIVGGFFYLDCETREEALAIAAECPAVDWATVEVRRVAKCFEEQDEA